MSTIFSNSIICQELLSEVVTVERGLVMLGTLVNAASGIDPNRIYQNQTKPSLVYVLHSGSGLGLNDTDWGFYINIKKVDAPSCTVLSGTINYSTDSAGDPTFEYEWQYGDTAVIGNYDAQIFGVYLTNLKQMIFEKTKLIIRSTI